MAKEMKANAKVKVKVKNPFVIDTGYMGTMTVRQLAELVGDTGEFPKGLDTRICIGDVEGNLGVNHRVLVAAHKPGDVILEIDPNCGDLRYDPTQGEEP